MSETEWLLDWLDRARAEMRAALKSLEPAGEIYPGWSMKDNIAHITGWDEVALKTLQAYRNGAPPYLLPPKDIDTHNNDMVQARAAMSYEEVLREWGEVREDLKAEIAALSDDDLAVSITYPWGGRGSLEDLLVIIAGHEEEHADELVS